MFCHSADGEPSLHVNRLSTHVLDPYEKLAMNKIIQRIGENVFLLDLSMVHVGEKLLIALVHFSHIQAFVFSEKTLRDHKDDQWTWALRLEYNIPGWRDEE